MHWNEGWVEEIEYKLHGREVEIINKEIKVEFKTEIN